MLAVERSRLVVSAVETPSRAIGEANEVGDFVDNNPTRNGSASLETHNPILRVQLQQHKHFSFEASGLRAKERPDIHHLAGFADSLIGPDFCQHLLWAAIGRKRLNAHCNVLRVANATVDNFGLGSVEVER